MLDCYAVKTDEDFKALIPHKPYCTDDLDKGLRVRPKDIALRSKYIQLNPPSLQWALVFDLDYPVWYEYIVDDLWLPEPTFLINNPKNGHAHLVYALNKPVCTSDAGRLHPLRYLAAIERAYIERLYADPLYRGLIAKNPWSRGTWEVAPRRRILAYDLEFLADSVYQEMRKARKERSVSERAGLGRNCYIFERLRKWAYMAIRDYWKKPGEWFEATDRQCCIFNQEVSPPLYYRELWGITKSVARWTWKKFTHEEFSRFQSHVSQKRWGPSKKSEGLQMLRAGLSPSEIAKLLGVDRRTIWRWSKADL